MGKFGGFGGGMGNMQQLMRQAQKMQEQGKHNSGGRMDPSSLYIFLFKSSLNVPAAIVVENPKYVVNNVSLQTGSSIILLVVVQELDKLLIILEVDKVSIIAMVIFLSFCSVFYHIHFNLSIYTCL